jgi:hypothetical protein
VLAIIEMEACKKRGGGCELCTNKCEQGGGHKQVGIHSIRAHTTKGVHAEGLV